MARSNSGGTRGWLRGKVANDLYQVTKTASGRKVQLVRAVEESRINNNTLEQAIARMRMALLMGALSDLKEIVDHSWEGVPYGQLSIAHFVKVNMADVIVDCKEHWNGENLYCYPTKNVRAMRIGTFTIATGSLPSPTIITRGVNYSWGQWFPFRILIGKSNPTFLDLKLALGLNALDYITLLMEDGVYFPSEGVMNQALHFVRLYLAESVLDETPITSSNVSSMFTYEGNTNYRLSINSSTGVISVDVATNPDGLARDCLFSAIVVSRWNGRVWCRNNAKFMPPDGSGGVNIDEQCPRWVFQSWFPSFDPDSDDAGEYPGK